MRAAGDLAGLFWDVARRALGLPCNVTPSAVVPLGWPIGRHVPTRRRPVEELVSLDRYGNRAFRSKRNPT